MKKIKKAYISIGIITAIFAIAAIAVSCIFNFTYKYPNIAPFSVYKTFAGSYVKSAVGTPGAAFIVEGVPSVALGFLFVDLGLVWMIVALAKKRFLGLLYGFLMGCAGFIASFGYFLTFNITKPGVGEIAYYQDGILGILSLAFCLATTVAFLAFFIVGMIAASQPKEPKAVKEAAPAEEPKEEEDDIKVVDVEPQPEIIDESEEEPVAEEEPKVEEKQPEPEPVVEEPAKPEEKAEEPKVEEKKEEPKQEAKPAPVKKAPAKKPAPKKEEKQPEPKKEEKPAEEPKEEKQPAEKKPVVKKGPVKPQKEEKPEEPKKVAKPENKKPEPKKEEKTEMAKEAPKKAEKKGDGKVYHVSKNAEKGLWEVKLAQTGGAAGKVIKTFKTKPEAEEYVNQLAENTGRTALFHASKGKNKGRILK